MITVLGLGFVGLTTGLGFAKKGFKTYGFDVNQERMNSLLEFTIPFHEPFLKEVLEETADNTFSLKTDFEEAVQDSDAVFLCVGTPGNEDGSADLTYLHKAIEQVLAVETNRFQVLIIKSTVPPSTISQKVIPYVNDLLKIYPNRKIGLASNPEFLREGHCWEDFIMPDRIVIGVEDESSKLVLDKIYQPFEAPIHYVSYNTAEFIKYLSNTLLSTLVSFANELSMIGHTIGDIDVMKAFKVLHEDKRWFGHPANMASYVYPGAGYGGYCLPKDTSALVHLSTANGFKPSMLAANLKINNFIKTFIAEQVESQVPKNENVGILGLSFKPNSDDVRFTPSKEVIELLLEKGYKNIYAYDPIATAEFQKHYPELPVHYCDSLDEIIYKTEHVIILTGWKEFVENKEKINTNNVYDYRYIL
jgi:UDPglucose 6-dehydrogenase